MAPAGVSKAGDLISNPSECLLRRARRKGSQKYVLDQKTNQYRPKNAIFEPRIREKNPGAIHHDEYVSVNILSSLQQAGLEPDWGCDHQAFYVVSVSAGTCHALGLRVTWEPDCEHDNPHHGAIHGLVERYATDRDAYERSISCLAKASIILPECLAHI